MKIALGQIEVTPAKPWKNTYKMLDAIKKAKRGKADIIVFPEMAIPGYLLGDHWEREAFLKECEDCNQEIVKAAKGIAVVWGNVAVDWDKINEDGRVRKYNACFVAEDRELLIGSGEYDGKEYPYVVKTLQPNYREFDDDRHFYSAIKLMKEGVVNYTVELSSGEKIACMICEDGWDRDYNLKPWEEFKTVPPDLYINLSCSPYTYGKSNKRHRVFSENAHDSRKPWVYVNCVGVQDNGKNVFTFDGGSCIYYPNGEIESLLAPFEERVKVTKCLFHDSDTERTIEPKLTKDDIGDLYNAVFYGTKKFMERVGLEKVVIGVSGGIDSALSTAIFSQILPKENILLINMPTEYNSETTRDLAKELADKIGCRYIVHPIQDVCEKTRSEICAINEKDGVENPDLTDFAYENVQARDRSSRVLAAWASWFGGAFTCNGNKSEMTVGYATLYGDIGGFVAPIADLWKTQVYEMAEWFNENVEDIIPQGTIDLIPSAELSAAQCVDAGNGDPLKYEYHDLLFSSWVERWDRVTPEEIREWNGARTLEKELGWDGKESIVNTIFNGSYSAFDTDLQRWWECYQGLGVAKRIQAPPIVTVSRRAFGFDHREAQFGVIYSDRYLNKARSDYGVYV